jgi:hypothetical protein
MFANDGDGEAKAEEIADFFADYSRVATAPRSLSGRLRVTSPPGGGTVIAADLPVPAA